MPGKFGPNSALLPIVLMMAQPGADAEKSLDDLMEFIQSTKAALQAMRNGIDTFHTGMLKMMPVPKPAAPAEMLPEQKAQPAPVTAPPNTE